MHVERRPPTTRYQSSTLFAFFFLEWTGGGWISLLKLHIRKKGALIMKVFLGSLNYDTL